MQQIETFIDQRMSIGCCVYCGGPAETRDHVPSRVLLDIADPDDCPENLPTVPACQECNRSFSSDEEYLACLIEIARFGTTDIAKLERDKVRKILDKKPALASRLSQGLVQQPSLFSEHDFEARIYFECERVKNVALKLARGHLAYELNEIRLEEPSGFRCRQLDKMSRNDKRGFGNCLPLNVVPEIGTRSMIRVFMGYDLDSDGWIVVQPSRYRYAPLVETFISVRIVLSEYLAFEVTWGEEILNRSTSVQIPNILNPSLDF